MDLANHTDVNLDNGAIPPVREWGGRRSRAVEVLPDLGRRPERQEPRNKLEAVGNAMESFGKGAKEKADGGIRTHDPSFTKAVLYH